MCEARLRPICLHPTLRVWLLLIQSLPSHKLGYLNKYHLFIAQTMERKFPKKSGKGTKPCIFHITMQKDFLWTRTAWMWQLSWHLFSLGAAGEPEKTVKSLGLTQEQGYEPLLPVSCRCITARLGHWICAMSSAKQHSTGLVHKAGRHTWVRGRTGSTLSQLTSVRSCSFQRPTATRASNCHYS